MIERHHATGRVGLGLVRGFGLHAGAFASTVAHDAHNLVVVGVVRRGHGAVRGAGAGARRRAGGRARRRGRAASCALPIAGLLSDRPLEEVAEGLEGAAGPAGEQGVEIDAPFMTLSFLALSVIPSLKITDRGLVDVDAFALVPLALNGRIELSREAFVARFGALYEHSPWVAERGVAAGRFAGARRARRRAARRDVRRAARRAARADPRAPGPRREGRRAHRALARRAGRARARPAPARRVRALHGRRTRPTARSSASRSWSACASTARRSRSWRTRTRRLGNTREQEIETALGEIAKIARLRLEDAL